MKKQLLRNVMVGAVVGTVSLSSCSKDSTPADAGNGGAGWLTLSGALMQTNPGDGDGGTKVYSIKQEDARNPNVSVDVFANGYGVKSSRTARVQASADGSFLYNIQYTGADGGVFNKYEVRGGNSFPESGSPINTAPYIGTSPRWVKAAEGIGVGVDVRVTVTLDGAAPEQKVKLVRSEGRIGVLDLNDPKIIRAKDYFALPQLSATEEAQGYHVFRFDAPVLNKAGDKLYIGTWMRKYDVNSFITYGTTGSPSYKTDATSPRLATRMLVVDYPSLENPHYITSTQATGDNSGYRSPMSYVGDDGYVYQATHREIKGTGGSKIIRIGQNNQYDNSYVINLEQALGVKDIYVESWKYAGEGVGYIIYSLLDQTTGARTGGYIARVNLTSRTATKVTIPNETTLNFEQHQGIAVHGDYVYIPVTGVGVDGNIYVFNRKTGEMTVGAKLINQAGNRYIGAY